MSGHISDGNCSKTEPGSCHSKSSMSEERTSRERPSSKVTPVVQDGSTPRDSSIGGKFLKLKVCTLTFSGKNREPKPKEGAARPEVATAQDNSMTELPAKFMSHFAKPSERSRRTTSERESPDKGKSLVPGKTSTDQDSSTPGTCFGVKPLQPRLKMFLSRFKKKRTPGENPDTTNTTGEGSGGSSTGAFNNARNMVIDNAIMWEGAQFHQTVHNTIYTETAVMQNIASRSCPYVALDSAARHPPPQCHPGTRSQLLDQLANWMDDPNRDQRMIWVKGLAGFGKTAVVQTFAERCLERNRLGASFFFQREWQIEPSNLVPTIACQFSMYIPEYQQLLLDRLLNDPSILDKAPRIQFTSLIVELVAVLQERGHRINQEPLVIVLDGLEECKGTEAQGDIVEMISEAVRTKENLPLLWLISSQPLGYLEYAFSKYRSPSSCSWREVQVGNAHGDVQVYLRDSFNGISSRHADFIRPPWPSDEQVELVSKKVNGFFALATAIVRYVDDLKRLHPMKRLTEVEALLRNCNHTDATALMQALNRLNDCLQSESTLDVE